MLLIKIDSTISNITAGSAGYISSGQGTAIGGDAALISSLEFSLTSLTPSVSYSLLFNICFDSQKITNLYGGSGKYFPGKAADTDCKGGKAISNTNAYNLVDGQDCYGKKK